MAYEFKLPDLGEGIFEGEIVKWFIKEGDEIKEDDSLCEVQNDKAVVEIPSPVEGTVKKIYVEEGTVAIVGDTIVSIDAEGYESDDSGEDEAKTESTSKEEKQPEKQTENKSAGDDAKSTDKDEQSDDKRVIAMPSVRKYAREQDV